MLLKAELTSREFWSPLGLQALQAFAGLVIPYAFCILPIPSPTWRLLILKAKRGQKPCKHLQTLHRGLTGAV